MHKHSNGLITNLFIFFAIHRLYGFKIHNLAYQIQLQAAASFKQPGGNRGVTEKNGNRGGLMSVLNP